VPGDIVKLSAGDMIPADLRILQARDLFVAQASLTGESLPVEKWPAAATAAAEPAGVRHPVLYGHQRGERLGAGDRLRHRRHTWFGQLAGRVSEQESEPNAFQKGISRVSMLLIRFMLVMAPVVLLINGYTKGDWWEAALFALSVAVGLTPEMLPMIVTSTLARGAVKLSKQKVIVKHLDAIQNFGAMDILHR
jgi:Mg2+-importing ATPase